MVACHFTAAERRRSYAKASMAATHAQPQPDPAALAARFTLYAQSPQAAAAYLALLADPSAIHRLAQATWTADLLRMRPRGPSQPVSLLGAFAGGGMRFGQPWQVDVLPAGHSLRCHPRLRRLRLPPADQVSRLAAWLQLPGAGSVAPRNLLARPITVLWCVGRVVEIYLPSAGGVDGGGRCIALYRGGARLSVLALLGPPVPPLPMGGPSVMAAAVQRVLAEEQPAVSQWHGVHTGALDVLTGLELGVWLKCGMLKLPCPSPSEEQAILRAPLHDLLAYQGL